MKTNSKLMLVAAAAMSGLIIGSANRAAAQPLSNSGQTSISKKVGMEVKTVPGTMLDDTKDKGKHDCKGKNDCKGQGGCKTDKNDCKGHNDCKGKGGCNTNKDEKK